MGIVAKQTLSNSVIVFSGAILGAINVMILYPIVLPDPEIGLTRILIAFTILFSQLASLGGGSMLMKFIPKFNKGNGDYNGVGSFIFIIGIIGFSILTCFLCFGKPLFEYYYAENSQLFIQYFFYLIPLVFFQILINYFGGLLQANFKTVFPNFVNEILIRLLSCFLLLFVFLGYLDFNGFMIAFVLIYALSSLIEFLYLLADQKIKFNLRLKFSFSAKKEVLKYGFANTLTSLASNLSNRIDLLMIGSLLGGVAAFGTKDDFNIGLYYITIYTISSYMATLIEMPARALSNIASAVISKAWHQNDINLISSLYKKSSINQLIVGVLIFLGIWINIDSLLIFTGKDYSSGKWVFLFLAFGKLINVASGVNGKIIILSKYYYIGTLLTFFLALITFVTNLFFIPYFEGLPRGLGIEGAALATAISVFLFNFFSFLFLLIKFRLQPFSYKSIVVLLISLTSLFIVYLVEGHIIDNFYFQLIVKSVVVLVVYITLTYFLNLSSDFNRIINKFFFRIFGFFNSK
ncbi:MAG: hypothetical protein CL853_05010 [Crocinitomicaceae bacterium]|nr:hypothetical protein [Crocinitomicaceae bacterium]|tara:strand:- start:4488 stop:6047 length:1560 start_codon:yes stop_codon:yes gene_type:complete